MYTAWGHKRSVAPCRMILWTFAGCLKWEMLSEVSILDVCWPPFVLQVWHCYQTTWSISYLSFAPYLISHLGRPCPCFFTTPEPKWHPSKPREFKPWVEVDGWLGWHRPCYIVLLIIAKHLGPKWSSTLPGPTSTISCNDVSPCDKALDFFSCYESRWFIHFPTVAPHVVKGDSRNHLVVSFRYLSRIFWYSYTGIAWVPLTIFSHLHKGGKPPETPS